MNGLDWPPVPLRVSIYADQRYRYSLPSQAQVAASVDLQQLGIVDVPDLNEW